ncbi:hypothetical protein EDC32_101301 [Laceyella sacchari]|jgi:hypothetical protein|uniref:hypothetical protein n=1 Tax=Laceyella sacchari TaxID=37482 RepID=UPI0010E9AC69|nr:hypothetical protein [Laceyella sacchari]TCW40655.1 hypothetical protein EDC32_101301 [Laceyella sacchari]
MKTFTRILRVNTHGCSHAVQRFFARASLTLSSTAFLLSLFALRQILKKFS